jgi:hypothetical protein
MECSRRGGLWPKALRFFYPPYPRSRPAPGQRVGRICVRLNTAFRRSAGGDRRLECPVLDRAKKYRCRIPAVSGSARLLLLIRLPLHAPDSILAEAISVSADQCQTAESISGQLADCGLWLDVRHCRFE